MADSLKKKARTRLTRQGSEVDEDVDQPCHQLDPLKQLDCTDLLQVVVGEREKNSETISHEAVNRQTSLASKSCEQNCPSFKTAVSNTPLTNINFIKSGNVVESDVKRVPRPPSDRWVGAVHKVRQSVRAKDPVISSTQTCHGRVLRRQGTETDLKCNSSRSQASSYIDSKKVGKGHGIFVRQDTTTSKASVELPTYSRQNTGNDLSDNSRLRVPNDPDGGDPSRLRVAAEAFQRKYRSMSIYGEHVIDIAERSNKALFCLKEKNIVRRNCKRLVESKLFDYFILLTIAANCVVLMIATPLPNDDSSELNDYLDRGDAVFVAIFTLEAMLKILGYGFILHPNAYLRSGWNILDFIVVLVGLVQVSSLVSDSSTKRNSESIRALRAVRVLRPLKLVSGIPSLQVVMKSLIRAMVPLLQILLLVLFVIVIYSIIGLELLKGSFHYTCFTNQTGILQISKAYERPRPCDNTGGWGRRCPSDEICRRSDTSIWPGPNDGITTFDNMFVSMLTVFQCITLEGWSEILYLSIDARDSKYPIVTWAAFILLIVIGSFFMLNLVLGVLSGEFAKERERVEKRKSFMKLRRQRQIDRQVDAYMEWINKAEELLLLDEDYIAAGVEAIAKTSLDINIGIKSSNLSGGSTRHLIDDDANPHERVRQLRSCKSSPTETKKNRTKRVERWIRLKVRRVIKSKVFNWGVLLVVLFNSVAMSLHHYNEGKKLTKFLGTSEKVFTCLFFAEMLLRVYGLGIRTYWRSASNRFDFAVVWLSLADLLINFYFDQGLGISVLRSFRLLRVFKVTRFWSSMQNIVTSLMNSMRSILSLILLLLLFIFIFALLGMQLFGGQFVKPRGTSRTNFDNFPRAMLAVFQIMTGEDWNNIMYNGIRAFGGPRSIQGMFVSLYFVALVIIGNYTLLNVFLAIAVDNLANAQALTRDEEEEKRAIEEARVRRRLLLTESRWKKVRSVPKLLAIAKKNKEKEDDNPFRGMTYKGRSAMARSCSEESQGERPRTPRLYNAVLECKARQQAQMMQTDPNANHKNPTTKFSTPSASPNSDAEMMTGSSFSERTARIIKRRQYSTNTVISKRAMFLFSQHNRFRVWCHKLVTLRHFDHVMLFIIITSSILLAIEDPMNEDSELNMYLKYCDIGFVAIFTFEILIKMVDQGVLVHKGSFLRDWWNVIDTFVVSCNIAAIALSYQSNLLTSGREQTLKSMRVLRVFRPLRVVNKLQKLKLVFQCMLFSLKKVSNIIIITLLCLFMFAVIGVNLFQGRFQSCNDISKLTREECQGKYYYVKTAEKFPDDIQVQARLWKNYDFNFDSVSDAMLTLFSSATGEGWPLVMQKTIDSTEVDHGPLPDNRIYMSLYYVCFVVVFGFFFLNIFVALIIVTFQEQGEKELTGCELDKNQRACLQFVLNAKPRQRFMPKDKNGFCYKVWIIVDSKPFEIAIMTLIALNAIVLMLSSDQMTDELRKILELINLIFTILFTIEAILKLTAYNWNYFRDGWNIFDFSVVLITLAGAFVNIFINKDDFPIDPSFFRLFRAFRLLKLLKQGYNIRILLWTFLQSFKALPYVMLLIAMLFFIYAVIGMQLFSKIKLDQTKQINEFNNFTAFFNAIQVLFRCATGEAWHLVMLACFDDAICADNPTDKCGSTAASICYFCSFYFFCSFLLLNLFVAVIMDNFDYLTRDESILGPHHMDEFVRVWSEYDPSAAGRIPHTEVLQLMCDMQPPVGIGKKCPKFLAYKRLMKMNMPVNGDSTVLFTSTLFALVRTSLGMTAKHKLCFRDSNLRKIVRRVWPNASPKVVDLMLPEQSVLSSQQITVGKIYAAKLIYESFKDLKRRKQGLEAEQEEEVKTHKGSSILRKFMNVMRTNSHPLRINDVDKRLKEADEYHGKRRRSNTFDSAGTLRSTALNQVRQKFIGERKQKSKSEKVKRRKINGIYYISDDDSWTQYDNDILNQSHSSRMTEVADISDINPVILNAAQSSEERDRTALTDSLITALRDPSKPILCFVNPQLPRELSQEDRIAKRTLSSDIFDQPLKDDSRNRSSTVTVTLPMIRLQIPVEKSSDGVEYPLAGNIAERLSPSHGENVPDLIQSTGGAVFSTNSLLGSPTGSIAGARSNAGSPETRSGTTEFDDLGHCDDSSQSPSSRVEENPSSVASEKELLRTLNDQIQKALQGVKSPYRVYEVKEAEEETWC